MNLFHRIYLDDLFVKKKLSMLYFGEGCEEKPKFNFVNICKKYLERPTEDVFIEQL